jgi:protein-tyrosine phosphatase
MPMGEAQRHIQLDGVYNLRDIGGYPTVDGRRTRWSTLYRSACLYQLELDGQQWLLEAGLRTIIDLRDREEVARRPNVFDGSTQLTYRRMPFWDEPPPSDLVPDVRLGYRRELDQLGQRLAELVKLLAAPDTLPALIHCAGGKDRTGLAIGVVLDAVGVQRQFIAEDYSLSERCLGDDYVSRTREWVEGGGRDWAIWEHVTYTPPERMLHTLAYLDDQFGGVERYLLDGGVESRVLLDLKELLTEPD